MLTSMLKTGIFTEELATKANRPAGSIATELGAPPAAKGEPGTGISAPVERSMAYAEIFAEPEFAT